MLNRRGFVSSLSALPMFGLLQSEEVQAKQKKEPIFFTKEMLKEEYLAVFPEGFHVTEENVQKLLDNGFDGVEDLFFPFTGKIVSDLGDGETIICYYLNSQYHREDGPAVIEMSGSEVTSQEWYKNGEYHREDGPAVIQSNGKQEYYINGKLHREGSPAVISPYAEQWFINGKLHREDGPAEIRADGCQFWYINGKRHREDGPAVIYANGGKEYYRHGEQLLVEDGDLKIHCKEGDFHNIEWKEQNISAINSAKGYLCFKSDGYYLNEEDGWVKNKKKATKYDSIHDAMFCAVDFLS